MTRDAACRSGSKAAAALLLIATLTGAIQYFGLVANSRLQRDVFDFGHVPVFALIAISALHFVRATRMTSPSRSYLAAALIVAVLSVASESLQLADAGRVASVWDLLRNLGGGAAGLLLASAWPRGNRRRDELAGAGRPLAAAVAVLFGLCVPVAWTAVAYAHRAYCWPTIAGANFVLERRLLTGYASELELPGFRSAWRVENDGPGIRVRARDGVFGGLLAQELNGSWHGLTQLCVDAFNPGDAPLRISGALGDAPMFFRSETFGRFELLLVPRQRAAHCVPIPVSGRVEAGGTEHPWRSMALLSVGNDSLPDYRLHRIWLQ